MSYTHGIRWTLDIIYEKIKIVMHTLNIKRMPSSDECIMVTGDSALSNAIRRHSSFSDVAKHLKIEIKNCETTTGKGFEELAIKILSDKGYKVDRMTTKYPFDLLINDNISIDVKASRPNILSGSRVHTVGINKKYATCNLYLIFALDENDSIENIFIIPGTHIKTTTLNFGLNSKYNIYINRWDILETYNNFYNSLKQVVYK